MRQQYQRRNLAPLFEALYGAGVFGEPMNVKAAKQLEQMRGMNSLELEKLRAANALAVGEQGNAFKVGDESRRYAGLAAGYNSQPNRPLINTYPLNDDMLGRAAEANFGAPGVNKGFYSSIPEQQVAARGAEMTFDVSQDPEFVNRFNRDAIFGAGIKNRATLGQGETSFGANEQFTGSSKDQKITPNVLAIDPKTGQPIYGEPTVSTVTTPGSVTPRLDYSKYGVNPYGEQPSPAKTYTVPQQPTLGPKLNTTLKQPPAPPQKMLEEGVVKQVGDYAKDTGNFGFNLENPYNPLAWAHQGYSGIKDAASGWKDILFGVPSEKISADPETQALIEVLKKRLGGGIKQ